LNSAAKHKAGTRRAVPLQTQYFSGTNLRPFNVAWSSYAPFFERWGSFILGRGTSL
jgi:hypothetical protein